MSATEHQPEAAVVVTALLLPDVYEIMSVMRGLMTTDADDYFSRAEAILKRLEKQSGISIDQVKK